MATLTAISFTIVGGMGCFTVSLVMFGCALRRRHPFIAPRCTARPSNAIYNPSPDAPECQKRGNPMLFGWIVWVMRLTFATMLKGVPGTGTRKDGLAGSLLKVNLDGIVLLRFHHLCLRVSSLAMVLYLLIVLPIYSSTPVCTADNTDSTLCQKEILTDYQQWTLANIPGLQRTYATDGFLRAFFIPDTDGILAKLYAVVICSWIVTWYAMHQLELEWVDVLALRRVYYLEADHWNDRLEELKETLLATDEEAEQKKKDKSYFPEYRDPWVPHPEQRDTIPNIDLYSILVGGLPSLPKQVLDTDDDFEAVFSRKQSIDWQLSVTTAFFDHCVPNQPGFSSSVAAVTILPAATHLTEAWKKWYRAASKLRRLRYIRQQIAVKRHYAIGQVDNESDDSDADKYRTEQYGDYYDDDEENNKSQIVHNPHNHVYRDSIAAHKYYQEVLGTNTDSEIESNLLHAFQFGPEQTAVYSREYANGAANLAPFGCCSGRIERASIDELVLMEQRAADEVHRANTALRRVQEALADEDDDIEAGVRPSVMAHDDVSAFKEGIPEEASFDIDDEDFEDGDMEAILAAASNPGEDSSGPLSKSIDDRTGRLSRVSTGASSIDSFGIDGGTPTEEKATRKSSMVGIIPAAAIIDSVKSNVKNLAQLGRMDSNDSYKSSHKARKRPNRRRGSISTDQLPGNLGLESQLFRQSSTMQGSARSSSMQGSMRKSSTHESRSGHSRRRGHISLQPRATSLQVGKSTPPSRPSPMGLTPRRARSDGVDQERKTAWIGKAVECIDEEDEHHASSYFHVSPGKGGSNSLSKIDFKTSEAKPATKDVKPAAIMDDTSDHDDDEVMPLTGGIDTPVAETLARVQEKKLDELSDMIVFSSDDDDAGSSSVDIESDSENEANHVEENDKMTGSSHHDTMDEKIISVSDAATSVRANDEPTAAMADLSDDDMTGDTSDDGDAEHNSVDIDSDSGHDVDQVQETNTIDGSSHENSMDEKIASFSDDDSQPASEDAEKKKSDEPNDTSAESTGKHGVKHANVTRASYSDASKQVTTILTDSSDDDIAEDTSDEEEGLYTIRSESETSNGSSFWQRLEADKKRKDKIRTRLINMQHGSCASSLDSNENQNDKGLVNDQVSQPIGGKQEPEAAPPQKAKPSKVGWETSLVQLVDEEQATRDAQAVAAGKSKFTVPTSPAKAPQRKFALGLAAHGPLVSPKFRGRGSVQLGRGESHRASPRHSAMDRSASNRSMASIESASSTQAEDLLYISAKFETSAGLRQFESEPDQEQQCTQRRGKLREVEKWEKVVSIARDGTDDKFKRHHISSGMWKMPDVERVYEVVSGFINRLLCCSVGRVINSQDVVDELAKDSTYAVVTFTSRQAAVAARHCLADSRGGGRWTPLTDLPVPPLADASAGNVIYCKGCCRPVTVSLNDQQKLIRKYLALVALGTIYFFYTIPLVAAQRLVAPENLQTIFPDILDWQEQSELLANLFSGIIPALVYTGFFAICPVIFKAISNFGSNATSFMAAENSALRYFWWFMLLAAFSGTSFSTAVIEGFDRGISIGAEVQQVVENVAKAIPTQVSATWLNWLIVRFTIVLPTQYLLQVNTFVFSFFRLKCCARVVQGGGAGGPVPYRLYIDSGVVMLCVFALAPASPLIAVAAFMYYLSCVPLLRWTMIFLYRPRFDAGGQRFPFIFDMMVSGMFVGQVLLVAMMALKRAVGPALLAAMPMIPTLAFRLTLRRRFLPAFGDAALLQTSLLDGWDTNEESNEDKREEFRRFLVDSHKAAFVPVCIANDTSAVITAEPAVVVALDTDIDNASTAGDFHGDDCGASHTPSIGHSVANSVAQSVAQSTNHSISHHNSSRHTVMSSVMPIAMPTQQRGPMMRRTSTAVPRKRITLVPLDFNESVSGSTRFQNLGSPIRTPQPHSPQRVTQPLLSHGLPTSPIL